MYSTVRERESVEVSSMAVVSRLASAPLLWVQCLSGKSVRLVIGRFWSLRIFFLFKAYMYMYIAIIKGFPETDGLTSTSKVKTFSVLRYM